MWRTGVVLRMLVSLVGCVSVPNGGAPSGSGAGTLQPGARVIVMEHGEPMRAEVVATLREGVRVADGDGRIRTVPYAAIARVEAEPETDRFWPRFWVAYALLSVAAFFLIGKPLLLDD